MSGNISDTNVDRIKLDIPNLIQDLQFLNQVKLLSNNTIDHHIPLLQDKYSNLYNTSKTLFNYIVTNIITPSESFNINYFQHTIDMMLNNIKDIQESKISQNKASMKIGTHLAHTYVMPKINEQK